MRKRCYTSVFIAVIFVLTVGFSVSKNIYAEENTIYCHVSFVDKEAFVLKSGEDRALQAVVNLPLVPGDIIYTESRGRCEIQFDNGTLMRLDKNTELKLDTILSKSLTTKGKITTLQLKKGGIFSMNQVYNEEIFQVITPTAAVKMIKRSTIYLKVNDDGETRGFVKRGKVGILYGSDHKSGKKEYASAGKGFMVTKDYDFKADIMEKDVEFTAWNIYINKKFKELHYGKSKVPAVIYRRSPGIVHFAEKWSTRFGVWEYNELFGYVWKPFADVFQANRPFRDANYVRVKGELVLVPNQPWGWAPAHLGTWFFSKTDGWIWIPGDAFSPGICSVEILPAAEFGLCFQGFRFSLRNYAFGSLGHWIYYIYGDSQLYYTYREHGSKAWRMAYSKKYNWETATKKPSLHKVPENIKNIITKMNRAPVEKIKKHVAFNVSTTGLKLDNSKIIKNTNFNKNKSVFLRPENLNSVKIDGVEINQVVSHTGCDWNPDSKWAGKVGLNIFYSSMENAVICPKLGISSRNINDLERNVLRRSVVDRNLINSGFAGYRGGSSNGSGSSYSGSSSGTGSRSTGSVKAAGTSSGSSGSSSGAKKK